MPSVPTSMAGMPFYFFSNIALHSATSSSSNSSQSYECLMQDPEIDPERLCVGAIVYIQHYEVCGKPLESSATGRMGPRKRGERAMRDLGWGHPAVIVQYGHDEEDGELWIIVVNMTSFNSFGLENCLQRTRDYYSNLNKSFNIKFANTLPMYPDRGDAFFNYRYFDFEFAHTTGGKMSSECVIALEGYYKVRANYLRAYGVRYPNSWDMRLDCASYKLLIQELSLEEQHYESLGELLDPAKGAPRVPKGFDHGPNDFAVQPLEDITTSMTTLSIDTSTCFTGISSQEVSSTATMATSAPQTELHMQFFLPIPTTALPPTNSLQLSNSFRFSSLNGNAPSFIPTPQLAVRQAPAVQSLNPYQLFASQQAYYHGSNSN